MVIVRERKSFNLDLCTTNNQAEYSALLEALIYLVELSHKVRAMPQVQICMDSQLVVHQVNRTWKCKDAALCELRNMAQEALDKLSATLTWVPREEIVPHPGPLTIPTPEARYPTRDVVPSGVGRINSSGGLV
jgi:ribonuclease HI